MEINVERVKELYTRLNGQRTADEDYAVCPEAFAAVVEYANINEYRYASEADFTRLDADRRTMIRETNMEIDQQLLIVLDVLRLAYGGAFKKLAVEKEE